MGSNSERWRKAAVIGSIWAAVEIIFGSFLHNLRMPFSGSLLAVMAVILVGSFVLRWKEQGLVWRAALITALMKSVSPSAVILGPMTGILLEGLLMELAFRMLGFNLFSALVAGVLAVSSALLHKIINLLILYGEDIIRIYVNLFQYAARQLRFPDAGTAELLWILLAGYTFFGLVAGSLAFRVSRLSAASLDIGAAQQLWDRKHQKAPLPVFCGLCLFLHLLALGLGLWLLNTAGLGWFLLLSLPYLAWILWRYPHALRKISRRAFWFQLGLLLLLSALFYDFPGYHGMLGSLQGLYTGTELVMRALLVVGVFTALSVELKNPRVEQKLRAMGFSALHETMQLAFAMLPEVIAAMPEIRVILRRPLSSLAYLNQVGDGLLGKGQGQGQA